jgi:hypothetical protein
MSRNRFGRESMRFKAKFMEKELRNAVTLSYTQHTEDSSKTKAILAEYGFVVVTNISSSEECKNTEALLYKDLCGLIDKPKITDSRITRVVKELENNEIHWPHASIPGIPTKGFCASNAMPQGEFAWETRLNPRVKTVFADLHETKEEEMCVGMDLPFFNPLSYAAKDTFFWGHADQDTRLENGKTKSYQGILYIWPSTKNNTSNTILVPKSHVEHYDKLLGAIPTTFGAGHGLYVDDVSDDKTWKELRQVWLDDARRVDVPAGSLLMFDSMMLHQGYPSGSRLAQTISWEPKSLRTTEALKRKLQAIHMGIGTTHWASHGTHHGACKSFLRRKPKSQVYNDYNYPHKIVFPLKPLKPVPLITKLNPYKASIKEMTEQIKPEYRDVL